MNYEALKLENQLCFPLYACSREIVKQYKPFLDEIGVTYTQYIAMMVLWEKKTVSVKELGEALYLDSGTLTPLLKKMEEQGLLTRTRDKADQRSVLVELTGRGEALKDKAAEIPAKLMQCIPLGRKDAADLHRLLYHVLDLIEGKERRN
ncbi:MAG: MarR family winged helix-turn-helix transcriptional regulator [Intestinibacillus sp.]